MNKTLIVARMRPGTEQEIASVFAASDATELPRRIGVQSRTLFRFQDLYMHLIEAEQPLSATVDDAREHPLFREVSKSLIPFVAGPLIRLLFANRFPQARTRSSRNDPDAARPCQPHRLGRLTIRSPEKLRTAQNVGLRNPPVC